MTSHPSRTSFKGRDRRRSPRVDVLGQLNVHVVSRPMSVTVREIGNGGFSIETTEEIPVGAVHRFQFYLDDDSATVMAEAKSVYSMRVSSGAKFPLFFTGFEFGPNAPDVNKALAELVEGITALTAE